MSTETKTVTTNGAAPYGFMGVDTAAEYLGVSESRVRQYGYEGIIETRELVLSGSDGRKRKRVFYSVPDVVAIGDRPKGVRGGYALGIESGTPRYIRRIALSGGRSAYLFEKTTKGKRHRRSFRTLRGAENYRDRYLAKLEEEARIERVRTEEESRPSFLTRIARIFRGGK